MGIANATAIAREQCPWCGSVITHEKFLEVQGRIRAEEKKQHETIATEMHAKYQDQLREQDEKLQKANTERAALEIKHRQDLESTAAAAKKAAEDAATQKAAVDLNRAREVLDAKHQEELLSVKADAAKSLDEVLKKLAELEAKSGQAEQAIDVLEALRMAFDDDRIIPVPPETGAATIIIEVKLKNAVCGKILIDARARKAWQTNFAKKLHDEMIEAGGDHAIVATLKLPSDEDQICEHTGVLVVHPARVVEIVRILRRSMVKMFQVKATTEQRTEKKSKLYDFITSTSGRQRLTETGSLAKQLQELHVQEKREHDKMWKKRGEIERKIEKVSEALVDDIEEIVGGSGK
jgi:hypothetical protein